jgi:hypothetical protein
MRAYIILALMVWALVWMFANALDQEATTQEAITNHYQSTN